VEFEVLTANRLLFTPGYQVLQHYINKINTGLLASHMD
jgi:hypothetical protein